jgi:hypothetical protein
MGEKHSDDGASLIIVLGLFGGLLTMVLALLPFASTNIANSARYKSHMDNSYAADGGLKLGLTGMKNSTFIPDGTGDCSSLYGNGYDLNGQHVTVTCQYDNTTYPKPGRQAVCADPGGTSAYVSPKNTCYTVYGGNTAGLTDTSGAAISKTVGTSQIMVPAGNVDVVFLVDSTNSMDDSSNKAITELKKDSTLSTIFGGIPSTTNYRFAQYRDFTSPNVWGGLPFTTSGWMDATSTKSYIKSNAFVQDATNSAQNENREADLYGLYRVIRETPWHSGATKTIVWVGDAPGNSPVCKALDPAHIAVNSIDKNVVGGLLPDVQLFSISLNTNGAVDRLNQSGTGNEYAACSGNGDNSQNQANFLIGQAHVGSRHFPNVSTANIGPDIQLVLQSLTPALVTASVSGNSCANVSGSTYADSSGNATFSESFTATSGMSGVQNCDVAFTVYDGTGHVPAGYTSPPTYVEKNMVNVISSVQFQFTAKIGPTVVARSSATYDMFTRTSTINSWHLI